ncbi:MAG: hypothetical protein QXO51_08080 [Halobacteria archaeon]
MRASCSGVAFRRGFRGARGRSTSSFGKRRWMSAREKGGGSESTEADRELLLRIFSGRKSGGETVWDVTKR